MKLKQILPMVLMLGSCFEAPRSISTAHWEVVGGERTTFAPDTITSVPVSFRGFWQFDSNGEGRYSYGAEGSFSEGAFFWMLGENGSWWIDVGSQASVSGAWWEETGRIHVFILREDGPEDGKQWQEDLFLEPKGGTE